MQFTHYLHYIRHLHAFQATLPRGQNDPPPFTEKIPKERDLTCKALKKFKLSGDSQTQSLFLTSLPLSIQAYIFTFLKQDLHPCATVCHRFRFLAINQLLNKYFGYTSENKERMILQAFIYLENQMNKELSSMQFLEDLSETKSNLIEAKGKLEKILHFFSLFKIHFHFMLILEENDHNKILIKGNLTELYHFQKACEAYLNECSKHLKRGQSH
ncbi:F-box protein [Parachlamydia sp. AcF125]|uniref:F-box protein n=1 Tax=Parachlamydia sp. AcF125 TaxID=2795736 RepID=UPI001BC9C509|nr:F-box protein [Parachlamydia sp. AcF125]MBS4167558.1 hypothetical protein [Parachlamydia sp. AcF125]